MPPFPLTPAARPTPGRAPVDITLAEALWAAVARAGVEFVPGVPGDYALTLLDALEASPHLRWVGGAGELGAGFVADGLARAAGLGVVVTTWGAGELVAASAAAGWTAEDVAVLHVVGAPSSDRLASGAPVHHSLGDGDPDRWTRVAVETTGRVHVVDAGDPARALRAALRSWAVDRRPTQLVVPRDLVASLVPADVVRAVDGKAATTAPEARVAAASLVTRFVASAPDAVLVPGHLVLRRGLGDVPRQLADLGVDVAPLPSAHAVVDAGHPHLLGTWQGRLSGPGVRDAVESCRGRVLLGAVLTDVATGGFSHDLGHGETLVVGRDRTSWRDEHVAVDVGTAVDVLVEALRGRRRPDVRPTARRALSRVPSDAGDGRDRQGDPVPAGPVAPDGFVRQRDLWHAIGRTVPSGWRVVVDPGTATAGALATRWAPDTVLETATTWSAIGFALPAAVGAALGDPGRRVLAVVGDGAAQVTVQELALVSRAGARPVLVLVDNGGYTIERLLGEPGAAHHDVPRWDWPAVLRGIAGPGLHVTVVEDAAGVEDALRAAVGRADRASVIVARARPLDAPESLRRVAAAMRTSTVPS